MSRAAPEGAKGVGREMAVGDKARVTPRDHPMSWGSLEPWLGLVATSWPAASWGEEPLPTHGIFPLTFLGLNLGLY